MLIAHVDMIETQLTFDASKDQPQSTSQTGRGPCVLIAR
jgi:hypothetical protein